MKRTFTKEHRRKLSEAHKGTKKPWVKPPKDRSKALINLRRGENHWAWKGGITSEANKIRNSYEYKKWRTSVFERDNYTCQKCGIRGVKLNAHHLIRFSDDKEKRLDISNGQTLCEPCHGKTKGHKSVSTLVRNKIKKKLLGRIVSDITRKKISLSLKGKTPWNKGFKKRNIIYCYCGKEFQPKKETSKFCSKGCATRSRYLLENNLITAAEVNERLKNA